MQFIDSFIENSATIVIFILLLAGTILYTQPLSHTRAHASAHASAHAHEGFLNVNDDDDAGDSAEELSKKSLECRDDFCIIHQNQNDLEYRCKELKGKKACMSKCCCGWIKYTGMDGDGECVKGDATTASNERNADNSQRDIDYYYFMGNCVKGRECMNKKNKQTHRALQ